MRRDVLRLSGWVWVIALLTLVLISGCTRAKSSGPPELPTGTAAEVTVSPAAVQATPTSLSGVEAFNATTTALAATATADSEAPESTEVPATATPTPVQTAEATATEVPQATDTPQATDPAATTAPPPASGGGTHTVQPGENLFRIALRYGLSHQELAAHNGIANPNFIVVGQVLKIPPSGGGTTPPVSPPSGGTRTHTVQPGENLFRIALKYNMLYTALAAANGLSYPYTVYPGQQLTIP